MNLCEDQDAVLFVSVSSEPRPALSMQQKPQIYWLNYEIELPLTLSSFYLFKKDDVPLPAFNSG